MCSFVYSIYFFIDARFKYLKLLPTRISPSLSRVYIRVLWFEITAREISLLSMASYAHFYVKLQHDEQFEFYIMLLFFFF